MASKTTAINSCHNSYKHVSNLPHQSFPGEACDRTRMRQHMPKSIYANKNLYVQISITDIALHVPKLSSQ